MDRDHELSLDYADVSRMMERFENRQKLKVEGDWYLCEQEGYPPFVCSSSWLTKEIGGYTVEDLKEMDWAVTPVKIFREGRTEE